MSGRRLDVTATQAVASMMAALTGAIAASGLGIAGTIIGAAFMSLASTVGAAVYKHYLARSNERLRAAATNLAPKASGNAVAAAVLRHHLHLDPDETAHLRPDGQAVVETRADGDGEPAERTATASHRVGGPPRSDSADARVRPALAGAARPVRDARADDEAGAGAAAAFGRGDFGAAAVAADIAAAVLGDHTTLGHASLGYTAAEHPAAVPAEDTSTAAELRPTADLAEAADLRPAPDLGDAADLRPTARLRPAVRPGTAAEPDQTARLRADGPRSAAESGMAATAGGLDGAAAGGPGGRAAATAGGPDGAAAGGPGGRAGHGRTSAGHGRRRRWLRLAGAVLGIFVLAMGAVTAVEAIAGKPLETLIWHRSGSGTTIGSVVGHPARHQPAIVPGNSPAPTQSSSPQPSSTSPGTTSPTPTLTPTPTPTPSDSAPSSPGTSPAPGSGTPAGPGTQAPSTPSAPGQ
jgi:hypothetical protein